MSISIYKIENNFLVDLKLKVFALWFLNVIANISPLKGIVLYLYSI